MNRLEKIASLKARISDIHSEVYALKAKLVPQGEKIIAIHVERRSRDSYDHYHCGKEHFTKVWELPGELMPALTELVKNHVEAKIAVLDSELSARKSELAEEIERANR